ncbi:MAG: class I SAM-dependent methyltransferase [Acidimicrobiales bacterium]
MSHFVGTSSFYAEYRPGYPDTIWDLLTAEARLDRSSRVLDLGCGPGTATLDLAARVGHVVAVDLDAEMVGEGRRVGQKAGATNIEWVNLAAENLSCPDDHFQLAVIGSAFHWMDRPIVATKCRSLLRETGVLALLGNPTPLMQIREGSAVGAAIGEVQDRWFRDDYYVLDIDELERPEIVLQQCGFSEVSVSYVPQVQEWSAERFLGFLRSTSSRPDQRLGDDFGEFAAEINSAIRSIEPSGCWTLEIPVEVIIGRP